MSGATVSGATLGKATVSRATVSKATASGATASGASIERLGILLGAALALTGCNALTDFDYTYGDVDAGLDASIGVDAGPRDAGARDSGALDGGPSDAAGSDAESPDGGPVSPCPTPCLGDLFDDTVDGASDPVGGAMFRFRADTLDALGLVVEDLSWDATRARWETAGSITTTVKRCGPASCAGSDGRSFAFRSDVTWKPYVELIAPSTGVFRIGGNYTQIVGTVSEVVISREHRNDVLYVAPVGASDSNVDFGVDASLVAGDVVRVMVRAASGGDISGVALSLWVSGPTADASTCMAAANLDDWFTAATLTLPAQCDPAVSVGLATTGGTLYPTETASVATELGSAAAMTRDDNSYLRLDGTESIDFSGDFTVQLWARFDSFSPTNFDTLFSNVPASVSLGGGVFLEADSDTEAITYGAVTPAGAFDNATSTFTPAVGDWHFYRLVRAGSNLRLCVDGQSHGTNPVGTFDYTSEGRATLGRFAGSGVFFDGAVDEVRVHREALPCDIVP